MLQKKTPATVEAAAGVSINKTETIHGKYPRKRADRKAF
jgi:hypothetical protein